MLERSCIALIAAIALTIPVGRAAAFDDAKYPDLRGAWNRTLQSTPRFDPSKPPGLAQEAPLTPEYQAVFEASLSDQAGGGQGNRAAYQCLPWGMPAMMNGYAPIQIIVFPDTTYMMIDDGNDSVRRIFTDGRDWPAEPALNFTGYSIGRWIDTAGDGRYDLLEIETRDFKGPRFYDNTGPALHADNQSIIRERIYLKAGDPDVLRDEITVIDHALTRPWSVVKEYRREVVPQMFWAEDVCAERIAHVLIGNEVYRRSADGLLMPTKDGQAPPDLKYFSPEKK